MKILNTLLQIGLINAVAFSLPSFASSEIEFHIEGVKQGEGKLMIQLFKGEDSYNAGEALVATAVSAKAESTVIKFTDMRLANMPYVFSMMKTIMAKWKPISSACRLKVMVFSNNAKPNFGPVPYSKMAFTISDQDAVVINKTHVIY